MSSFKSNGRIAAAIVAALAIGATGKDGRPLNQRFHFGNMVLSRFPIVASPKRGPN